MKITESPHPNHAVLKLTGHRGSLKHREHPWGYPVPHSQICVGGQRAPDVGEKPLTEGSEQTGDKRIPKEIEKLQETNKNNNNVCTLIPSEKLEDIAFHEIRTREL